MNAELRMTRDILNQPASLTGVLRHQLGAGRAALEQAASAVRDARRIVVTGMGASLYAAMPLACHLGARGLPCITVETGELLHFGGDVARGAVVILVSRSGETVEAVRLLPKLRAGGATVIGITNEPGTMLDREADVSLLVSSAPDEAVAVQSYTGTLLATLLLGACVSGEDRQEEAERAIDDVSAKIEECSREASQWRTFLDGASVAYLLGRGPSLASAKEGALLLNETAKFPSVCMACGGFRHGPLEVVDAGFRAFLFRSQPATGHLDDALARSITTLGGRVQVISAPAGFFAPMIEIVPLQYAAYYAAEARGFTPGRFRYVSLITTSES